MGSSTIKKSPNIWFQKAREDFQLICASKHIKDYLGKDCFCQNVNPIISKLFLILGIPVLIISKPFYSIYEPIGVELTPFKVLIWARFKN